jgi:polyribonucleotide nucleotidyltransferase
MSNKFKKTLDFAGQTIKFEVGEFAPRANAAVVASMGETVILVTVAVSNSDTDKDYFPLSVEYVEKFYAGGIISGSRFVKRERFPSDSAILNARMVDRSLRPLFPTDFKREVQIVVTVLSYDDENDPAILAINAASAAVMISEIPFDGPVAGVRIGLLNKELVVNPTDSQIEKCDMDFVISGYDDKIVMIDAGAHEVDEKRIEEAFDLSVKHFKSLIKFQKELYDELKPVKITLDEHADTSKLTDMFVKKYDKDINSIIYELKGNIPGERRSLALDDLVVEFATEHEGEYSKTQVRDVAEKIVKERVRRGILEDGKRPSLRKMDEIRPIEIRVGVLPRTHGSAFFARGITQSLSIVTLGSTRLEQVLESFEGEESKRFMHHYNGPGYSVGEAGRYMFIPGRREIGHGALVEKALVPVIPSEEEFPYTIRVVSEILSQQGSSSMAATCGTTLALMDAGVPIKTPVSGIAIGLVTSDDGSKYELLTDIQDLEDFYGDMDFKVAGSRNGVTAVQMDNKLHGVPVAIIKEALVRAKKGRKEVLEKIMNVIDEPRKKLSKYAPKISTLKINPLKIGDLIGPGGKVIRGIIEDTGVEIDVKEDGNVHVAAVSEDARKQALERIRNIVEEPEVGKIYEGTVEKVVPYGAFISITPSISGLVHVSEMADGFVKDPGKIVEEGEKIKVKVIGINDEGRVNLSIKRAKNKKE